MPTQPWPSGELTNHEGVLDAANRMETGNDKIFYVDREYAFLKGEYRAFTDYHWQENHV